MTQNQLHWF